MARPIVYFICTGNSARSQMAEGFARALGGHVLEAHSAGTHPKGLHPLAVAAMAEAGVDISQQRSKPIDLELLRRAHMVITLCGDAEETCPLTPPEVERRHWPLPDPARADGPPEAAMAAFRAVRDEIRQRVEALVKELAGRA